MDDQTRPIGPDERERLKPRMKSRSLPVPPLIPTIAAVALIVGISLGYGLALKVGPGFTATASASPSASPDATPVSIPSPQSSDWAVYIIGPAPTSTFEQLPVGGLTLAQAIAAARAGWPFADSDLISASIVQPQDVVVASQPNRWVWEVVIRGSGPMVCADPLQPSDSPQPVASCSLPSSVAIYVDYVTGEWLYATAGSGY
jgi:hypothetical protein